MRKAFASLTIAVLVAAAGYGWLWHRAYGPWAEWEAYASHFIQDDGRVVDHTAEARSTSEGQAYSLFFALVANDRVRFDRILDWTRDNLCEGDFGKQLPSWLWGKKDDGSWGVIDRNAATDADLWLAYTLLQAGRLWHEPSFGDTGRKVLDRIRLDEVATAGAAGLLLLPAPQGFALESEGNKQWRLNPSYYPRFQFDALVTEDPAGPWAQIWQNYQRLLPQLAVKGLAPDWFLVDAEGHVLPDAVTAGVGSYDAIRVYLWAGLSQASDPAEPARWRGFARMIGQGRVPEKIDTAVGDAQGEIHPAGYAGAVLPWLKSLGEDVAVKNQERELRNRRRDGLLGQPPHYYDQVLALFGEGWVSKRFRFGTDGRVTLRWENLWSGL